MKYRELYAEYNYLLSKQSDYLKIISDLKQGYISTKTISGKKYYYLQKKADGKTQSEYIRGNMLPQIKAELQKREEMENELKIIDEQLNKLEAAVKLLDANLYRRFIILKRCSLMDSMPVEMRKKSLEFSNAMTALEGIPAGADTEENLSLWASGQYSFKNGYLQVLAKYNLIEV